MSSTVDLRDYGWASCFAESLAQAAPGLRPGRVVRADRQLFQLQTEDGVFPARLPGRFCHAAASALDLPTVGDWVGWHPEDAARGDGCVRIVTVLPRRSQLVRKVAGSRTEEQVLAANFATVFLVMGLDADFNLRRLERLLTTAWESGAQPVVVLNKTDLCAQAEERQRAVERLAPGVPVHGVSCARQQGLTALDAYLGRGRTVVLLGSSGVGKSTLINRFCQAEVLRTGAVRSHDQRGQHTTTHRQLVLLPRGGLLIDGPGIRELQLWTGEESLEKAFTDLEALAVGCRFRNCQHQHEPGCAVQAAVQMGTLKASRLASWHALQKELRVLALRQDGLARQREKRKVAALHQAVKRFKPRG